MTAPAGFYFPPVCRQFLTNTGISSGTPLPSSTTCQGESDRVIRLTTPPNSFLEPKAYSFRVLVENPSIPFKDILAKDKLWTIATYLINGKDLIDINKAIVGFDIRHRAKYFAVESLNAVGLYRTALKLSFSLYSDLSPQSEIHIYSPESLVLENVGGSCLSAPPGSKSVSSVLSVLPLLGNITTQVQTTQYMLKH